MLYRISRLLITLLAAVGVLQSAVPNSGRTVMAR